MKNQKLNIAGAKQISMISFLDSLGMHPVKVLRQDHWYICPFYGERTASFKVNANRNQWYHFGMGQGGDLIDFGTRYFNCTTSDFLQLLCSGNHTPIPTQQHEREDFHVPLLLVTGTGPISSPALITYLQQRRISIEIARQYCVQLNYELYDRKYFGIGFVNKSGGYEIRNALVKLCSRPKDLSLLSSGNPVIAIFEGFIDFLSYLQLNQPPCDYLILNSASFLNKALSLLEPYKVKLLYLDNDPTGDRCTQQAIGSGHGYSDCRPFYKSFHDLNDWLMAHP